MGICESKEAKRKRLKKKAKKKKKAEKAAAKERKRAKKLLGVLSGSDGEVKKKKHYVVSSFDEIPTKFQKVWRKSKIDKVYLEENLDIVVNVLRFTHKVHIYLDLPDDHPSKRADKGIPDWARDDASESDDMGGLDEYEEEMKATALVRVETPPAGAGDDAAGAEEKVGGPSSLNSSSKSTKGKLGLSAKLNKSSKSNVALAELSDDGLATPADGDGGASGIFSGVGLAEPGSDDEEEEEEEEQQQKERRKRPEQPKIDYIRDEEAREVMSEVGEEVLDDAMTIGQETGQTDPSKLFKNLELTATGGYGRVFEGMVRDTAVYRTSSGAACMTANPERTDAELLERIAVKKLAHNTPKAKLVNSSEIGCLHTCRHPNIVSFYGCHLFLTKEKRLEVWIVTEFMQGGTLQHASQVRRFDEPHIAYVGREMLYALKFLHERHIAHRDLKSSNVMLTFDGDVKLIDFGLAVNAESGKLLHMCGSAFWMPPEMIRRTPYGVKVDIWSFAVSLIEMAKSHPPNRKSKVRAMFVAAAFGLHGPRRLSSVGKRFFRRCLQLDPAQRATADELLEDEFIRTVAVSRNIIKNTLREIFLHKSVQTIMNI